MSNVIAFPTRPERGCQPEHEQAGDDLETRRRLDMAQSPEVALITAIYGAMPPKQRRVVTASIRALAARNSPEGATAAEFLDRLNRVLGA